MMNVNGDWGWLNAETKTVVNEKTDTYKKHNYKVNLPFQVYHFSTSIWHQKRKKPYTPQKIHD